MIKGIGTYFFAMPRIPVTLNRFTINLFTVLPLTVFTFPSDQSQNSSIVIKG